MRNLSPEAPFWTHVSGRKFFVRWDIRARNGGTKLNMTTTTIVVNIILAAFVLGTMLALHGWAIRTQWRDLPAQAAAERQRLVAAERRRHADRRQRAADAFPAHAERRQRERRTRGWATA